MSLLSFNKCECTMDNELADRAPADAARAFTRWQHFSAWVDVMAAILNVWHDVIMGNPTPSIECVSSNVIYLRNNPAKFHPDPIWNDGSLGFWKSVAPNKKKNYKTSSDMRSVPHLKIIISICQHWVALCRLMAVRFKSEMTWRSETNIRRLL